MSVHHKWYQSGTVLGGQATVEREVVVVVNNKLFSQQFEAKMQEITKKLCEDIKVIVSEALAPLRREIALLREELKAEEETEISHQVKSAATDFQPSGEEVIENYQLTSSSPKLERRKWSPVCETPDPKKTGFGSLGGNNCNDKNGESSGGGRRHIVGDGDLNRGRNFAKGDFGGGFTGGGQGNFTAQSATNEASIRLASDLNLKGGLFERGGAGGAGSGGGPGISGGGSFDGGRSGGGTDGFTDYDRRGSKRRGGREDGASIRSRSGGLGGLAGDIMGGACSSSDDKCGRVRGGVSGEFFTGGAGFFVEGWNGKGGWWKMKEGGCHGRQPNSFKLSFTLGKKVKTRAWGKTEDRETFKSQLTPLDPTKSSAGSLKEVKGSLPKCDGKQSAMGLQVTPRFDKFMKKIGPHPFEPNFPTNKKRHIVGQPRFIIFQSIPTYPTNNYEIQKGVICHVGLRRSKRDSIIISEVRSTLNLPIFTKPTQFSTCDLNGNRPASGLCDPCPGVLPQVLKPNFSNLAIIVPTQLCANTVTAFTPNSFSICNSYIPHSTPNSTQNTHNQTLSLDKLLDVSAMGKPLKLLKSSLDKEEIKLQCKPYSEDDGNDYCLARELSANYYPP